MNILTFSSLYPNAVDPSNGIFVERRLMKLLEFDNDTASVVSPVPWFPFRSRLFGRYADLAAIPASDLRNGIEICYPRFPRLPKIGMLTAPLGMAIATAGAVRRVMEKTGPVSIIDAHYFYPDGVAAARLAERFGLPFVVTARGTDINVIAEMPGPRRLILAAADKAAAVIAVSEALGRSLRRLGVEPDKIHVLPNGVDLEFFSPGDRQEVRIRLGLRSPTFISVGALKEAKGHDVAIRALQHFEDARLIVIGEGAYEGQLRRLVESLRLEARVSFTGRLDARELVDYYRAADALFLMSHREGMPNVVLESLACGTPVIAADVGGIGEVLSAPHCGVLLDRREPRALAAAWQAFTARHVDREAVRRAAEGLSWDETIARLHELLCRCATARRH